MLWMRPDDFGADRERSPSLVTSPVAVLARRGDVVREEARPPLLVFWGIPADWISELCRSLVKPAPPGRLLTGADGGRMDATTRAEARDCRVVSRGSDGVRGGYNVALLLKLCPTPELEGGRPPEALETGVTAMI